VRLFTAEGYPGAVIRTLIVTDASGKFVFKELDAPETYILEFARDGFSAGQTTRQVTVDESESVTLRHPVELDS
jgi:hypothetical protein